MIIFKVIVIGDSSVGKTCLMNNYIGKCFNSNEHPTIGVEFDTHVEDMNAMILSELMEKYRRKFESNKFAVETTMKLHIWNTSGQERFHSIVKCYYRNIHGIIFCCDLTNRSTLEHIEFWMNDYLKNGNKSLNDISIVLVATKSDLVNERQISDEDLHNIATKYQMPYFVVSNKQDHEKIVRLFHVLSNLILDKFIVNNDSIKEEELERIRIERDDIPRRKWCLGC